MKTFCLKKIEMISLIVVIILSILRLGIFIRLPYNAIGDSGFDDRLLTDMANSLIMGKWLGEYSYVTLIKGVSFPLFMAVAYWLNLSYPFLLGISYLLGAFLVIKAFRMIFDNKLVSYILYVFLIYNPVGFDSSITERLYRNALLYPVIMGVVGCILIVFFMKDSESWKRFFWYFCLGIIFGFFYYIREDSIWLIPLFVGGIIITIVWVIFFSKFEKWKKLLRSVECIIPIIVFLMISLAYHGINYKYYGVFQVNDRSSSSFSEMTGRIIKLEDESGSDVNYWITKDTLVNVCEACPTLKQDEKAILSSYKEWADETGNVKGDWSVWAIRIALNRQGYYESAQTIADYCTQVNNEIDQALAEGRLRNDQAIHFSNQSRGFYLKELPYFFKDTLKNIWNVQTCKEADCSNVQSSGLESQIHYMKSLTDANVTEPSTYQTVISGWCILNNKYKSNESNTMKVELVNKDGVVSPEVEGTEREDVHDIYPDDTFSLYSGFSFQINSEINSDDLGLNIYCGDELVGTYMLESCKDDNVILNVDQADVNVQNNDFNMEYSERVVATGDLIIWIERVINLIFFPLSLIGFALLVINFLRDRQWKNFEAPIVLLGLLLSQFLLEFGVTIFNSWLDAIWFYSTGVVAIGSCFEILTVAWIGNYLQRKSRI